MHEKKPWLKSYGQIPEHITLEQKEIAKLKAEGKYCGG